MNLGLFNYFTIVFIIIGNIQYMFTTSQVLDRPLNFKVKSGASGYVQLFVQKTLHEIQKFYIHIKPNLISSKHTQC
jgi:hypothetical protein